MHRRLLITLLTLCFCKIFFAQKPKLMLPIGHTISLTTAEFSPDGNMIATASADGNVKIWQASSGSLITNIIGHKDWVNTVQFSPDGKKVVTASMDSSAKIWDPASGSLLADLKGHTLGVYTAEFSPDGKMVVTASWDNTAKIWDVSSGVLLADLKGHTLQLNSSRFSPDGKKIVTASMDNTAKIWNVSSGTLLADLKGHNRGVYTAEFSPDGKMIVTSSIDSTAKIWDVFSGTLLANVKGHTSRVNNARFSPDVKKILTSSWDNTAKIWDVFSGALLVDFKGHINRVNKARFSPDGKKIVTASTDSTAKIWDASSGALLADLKGHTSRVNNAQFSPDGKKIVTSSWDNTAKTWDIYSGSLLADFKGHTDAVSTARFNPDGKKIVTASEDGSAKVWDVYSGKLLANLKGHTDWVLSANFSTDGKKIVTASKDNTAKIWDATSGSLLANLNGHTGWVNSADFSPDGKMIVTASRDSSTIIWDIVSGAILINLKEKTGGVISAEFSPDGKKIVTASLDSTAKIWDVASTTLLTILKGHTGWVLSARFSPDGKKIVTASFDSTAKVWDATSGAILTVLKWHAPGVYYAEFSPDGKKIATASLIGTVKIWDAASGILRTELKGHTSVVHTAEFSPDGKKIITSSADGSIKIWNSSNGKELYTFFTVDNSDYLIVDKDNHYDGTESARKLLFFTCGTEVIELDQVKDQLWVPNLVERIMSGDSINAPKLADLNICGLTPELEEIHRAKDEYRFSIKPRRGGLGQTLLYINGIEVRRYRKEQLQYRSGTYELFIKKQELAAYFIPGGENPVTVKAWVADNTISSRGVIIRENKTNKTVVTPNLYAVMVGVSDYKGEELDLKYAAKDATDISNAVAVASRKLLNIDGKEHVFVYNLTNAADRYLLPEKNGIKKTLEEIGKKATANDILLIFFAGHGIMQGSEGNKQFYFLTADASKLAAGSATEVGISTAELAEWMKPSNIKAQKRIMIFDACNSGQAIRDFVQLGKPGQGYIAARSDEKGQQIKAIEKLNNQSGLIILAASASNQNAYEMGRYSQGLLTYSLLKVMKQQPEILESGKYLDVSNWLNAAQKMVSKLAEGNRARQEPQLNTNNNFIIGLVDEEVRNKIILSAEKPLFTRSNFQNADTKLDNLKLRSAIDKELMNISSRGGSADITYSADYEGVDAYTLTGDYKIVGAVVTVNALLVKGGTEVKYTYEIKGTNADLTALVTGITSTAFDWMKKN